MKKIIWTSANNYMGSMLIQWLISLRILGRYNGEILILDYGLDNFIKDICINYNVKFISSRNKNQPIVNYRYIDIIPILVDSYHSNDLIAHFDADIWFQSDINYLFEIIKAQENGCLFSPDVGWFSQPYLGFDNQKLLMYNLKIEKIKNQYGGTIQGGFSAGLNKNIINKYSLFKKLIETNQVKNQYGDDQFAFNLLFDDLNDSALGHLFNCVSTDCIYNNSMVYTKKYNSLDKCIGIHLTGMVRHEQHRTFKYNHKEIFINELIKYNINHNSHTNIYLHNLINSNTDNIEKQLVDLINLCKANINHCITIGFDPKEQIFTPYDVGCTNLVPLEHGNIHYWDILKLERRQHIAEPNKLFISKNAVYKISQISDSYPKNLCNKFTYHWFDFMLSIMLVEHNIAYGLIV